MFCIGIFVYGVSDGTQFVGGLCSFFSLCMVFFFFCSLCLFLFLCCLFLFHLEIKEYFSYIIIEVKFLRNALEYSLCSIQC